VLGISNLSQVRASNLQELVYKQGQAGVQKATVTLVFNNEDDATSPLGYEQYGKITVTRQVIIGGRNKYLINGHTAQLNQVQNLFHSVQLNVNNPHFLIMQGRITKVLNMKPPEILSMLEEAAGTRLFEVKKEAANDFYKADVTMTKAVEQVQEVQNDLASLTADSEEAEAKVSDGNNQIEELRKDKELEMGADFKKAEAKVTEMSKTMVKQASVWQNKKETLDSDKEGCQTIRSGIEDAGKQTKNVSQKLATAEQTCAHLEAESKALTDRAEDMQRQLLAGELSTDAGEGADGSLADQLEQAKTKVTSSGTAAKQLEMKVKHMRAELEAKSKEQGKGEKEYAGLATAHQKLDRELKAITIKLHEVDYDESKERDLLGKKTAAEQTIETLQEKVDDLSSKLSRISFEYADPVKGFDKSKVKGLVAELLELKDPNTATALEVVAGGGLYSVVVDSDQTGKLLLKNGKLKKRVTIIPLNKIDTRGTISEKKMQTAAKLVGSSNISTALSLVGYESEIEAAMKYVFGRSFVCKNAKVAEAVTYHKDIKTKCVTLDGDIFQPSGTLSGGSRPQSASVLERLQALHDAQKQLDQNKRTLERINAELVEVQRTGAAYRELHSQKEMKSHEADMIRARIETSTHQQQLDEIKGMEAELDVSRENLKASFDDKKAAELKCKELDKAIKNFEKDRANKMKEIEDQVAKAKKDAAAGNKKWKDSATKYEELKLEAAEAENESESLQKQLQDKEAGLLELEQAVTELEEKAAECKQNYEDANTDLDSRRKRISDCEKEIVKLTKVRVC
jgi:structural maintenance of chromosome 2